MNKQTPHPFQTALAEKHAELLADVDLVADRANQGRLDPRPHAVGIVDAAEVALVRVTKAWRDSRGGRQNNAFFQPMAERLRRIIQFYRKHINDALPPAKPGSGSWVYKIIDFEQIPFHRLRPFFRASAVDEAIKTGILLGLRELPGVQIYEELRDE